MFLAIRFIDCIDSIKTVQQMIDRPNIEVKAILNYYSKTPAMMCEE